MNQEEHENAASEAPDTDASSSGVDSQLAAEREQSKKYLTNWQRAEADFQNFKRRTEHERADIIRFGVAGIVRDLLGVLDDLDRAIQNATSAEKGWIEGVELTRKNLISVLERHGVTEIEAVGEVFDPSIHEAVMQGPGPDGKVVEVLKRGFRLHDRVVRPAMVKVGSGE